MFQLLLLRGYRSLRANSAAHFLAFGCGASSLIWFDSTLMSLQVVKRSNTLSEWELFFNVAKYFLGCAFSAALQPCYRGFRASKWLLDILKTERRVLSGDSKSNGGTWLVIFSIRNKYFPQFYAGMTSVIKHAFSYRKTLSMWSHVLLCTTLESNTMQERWDHNISLCLFFLLLCFCGFNGAHWFKVKSPKANHMSRCYSALYLLQWKPLSDALLWLGTGGVWREGDAGEEQRHLQRRHPEHAEGEQVGPALHFCISIVGSHIYLLK